MLHLSAVFDQVALYGFLWIVHEAWCIINEFISQWQRPVNSIGWMRVAWWGLFWLLSFNMCCSIVKSYPAVGQCSFHPPWWDLCTQSPSWTPGSVTQQLGLGPCSASLQNCRNRFCLPLILPKPVKTPMGAGQMFSKEIPNWSAGVLPAFHKRRQHSRECKFLLPPGNGSVWAREIPDVLRSRVADGIMIFQILMNNLTELVHFTVCSSVDFFSYFLSLPPSPSPSLCSSHIDLC